MDKGVHPPLYLLRNGKMNPLLGKISSSRSSTMLYTPFDTIKKKIICTPKDRAKYPKLEKKIYSIETVLQGTGVR